MRMETIRFRPATVVTWLGHTGSSALWCVGGMNLRLRLHGCVFAVNACRNRCCYGFRLHYIQQQKRYSKRI